MWNPSDIELAKLDEWLATKDLTEYAGCIGGRFTYMMTPTNLGIIYKVRDNLKADEIDLTEYDW